MHKSLSSVVITKMLTVKCFPPIIIGKAFNRANSQCLQWYIRELLPKNACWNEDAAF